MNKRLICVAGLLALAGCDGLGGGGGNMTAEEVADEIAETKLKPGMWETTQEVVSMEMPGVPAEQLKAAAAQKATSQSCITPEQANSSRAEFLANQQQGKCTSADWSMSGGKMKGTMTCAADKAESNMVMKIDGDFGETSYDIAIDTEMAGGVKMKARSRARRIGDCPAGAGARG